MTDWKDLLSIKVANGELPPAENSDNTIWHEKETQKKDILKVLIDRKGRKGKTATIVEGFSCGDSELRDIAASLKSRLGTGGSARGGEILIQGDHCEDTRKFLQEMGYKVK